MLSCALPFEGRVNVGSQITNLMVAAELLTENVRDGEASAWRDYQQVLAELGLIYSTRICRAIRLTELGKSFVATDVNYSSMMGMQSFRYQYPNGQKFVLQDALKAEIAHSKYDKVQNQIELHTSAGVLIRPAILILRVLYQLYLSGDDRPLSLDEVAKFLLPSKKNSEWPICVTEVANSRATGVNEIRHDVTKSRRNLQDWFKLLRENPFFYTDGSRYIGLSEFAFNNTDRVLEIIFTGEDLKNFWIPTGYSVEDQMEWFSWFGKFGEVIVPVEAAEFSSAEEEYNAEEETEEDYVRETLPVTLAEVDEDALLNKKGFSFNPDANEVARNVAKGSMKRYAKHVLHDEIVAEFSKKFKAQGAKVVSDPNSVDLLVFWGEKSALFEVKTVNYRSMQSRLRLALGQVEEYSFRLHKDHGLKPDRCVILNRSIDKGSWQAEFFAEYMKVGIISRTSSGTSVIPPRDCESSKYWA